MKALILAVELINKYNQMPINDFVKEVEEYTGMPIPKEAVHQFKFTGLNNVDFVKSDYLNQYGIKNIFQQ